MSSSKLAELRRADELAAIRAELAAIELAEATGRLTEMLSRDNDRRT